MHPSKEQQKIICIDYIPKEKHLASPHLNLQLHKKKTNQLNKDIPDTLELLVVDVADVVVVKVVDKLAVKEEVVEEEAYGPRNWEPNKGRGRSPSGGRWRNRSPSPGDKGCSQSMGRQQTGPLPGVTMASDSACYFCGQDGHSIRFCYQNPNNSCFNCGLRGHMA